MLWIPDPHHLLSGCYNMDNPSEIKSREITFVHIIRFICPIVLKPCTEHDSATVVLCAKFQNDWITERNVMNKRDFTRFQSFERISCTERLIQSREFIIGQDSMKFARLNINSLWPSGIKWRFWIWPVLVEVMACIFDTNAQRWLIFDETPKAYIHPNIFTAEQLVMQNTIYVFAFVGIHMKCKINIPSC